MEGLLGDLAIVNQFPGSRGNVVFLPLGGKPGGGVAPFSVVGLAAGKVQLRPIPDNDITRTGRYRDIATGHASFKGRLLPLSQFAGNITDARPLMGVDGDGLPLEETTLLGELVLQDLGGVGEFDPVRVGREIDLGPAHVNPGAI